MAKKNEKVNELREEYINFMMATGGKEKAKANKLYAEAVMKEKKSGKKK